MQKTYLYGANNYSGVKVQGLKDSVYDIKALYPSMPILEENPQLSEQENARLINLNKVTDVNQKIYNMADSILEHGDVPVLFAGDHSCAVGSVSATAKHYGNIGVVWVDAHPDINDETTTHSGNIHGMPIAFLLGNGCEQLVKLGGFAPKIKPQNIVYIGLRSIDPGETKAIQDLNIKSYLYEDVKRLGIKKVLEETLAYLQKVDHIHLSFDFDSMDPTVFSAVSTPVPEGLTPSDVYAIFDTLIASNKLKAIDLVEYNKSHDDAHHASFDFVKSLLQKIL